MKNLFLTILFISGISFVSNGQLSPGSGPLGFTFYNKTLTLKARIDLISEEEDQQGKYLKKLFESLP